MRSLPPPMMSSAGMSKTIKIDARGLLCPMPVIELQNRIYTLNDGDQVYLTATDYGTQYDVPAWVNVHGHVLLETQTRQTQSDGVEFSYLIQVKMHQNSA